MCLLEGGAFEFALAARATDGHVAIRQPVPAGVKIIGWIAVNVLVGLPVVSGDSMVPSIRNVHMVIGAVLSAGFLVFLSLERSPTRTVGPLPTLLQHLIERIAGTCGGRVLPDWCTMTGNVNFGVTCRVAGVRHVTLRDALLQD